MDEPFKYNWIPWNVIDPKMNVMQCWTFDIAKCIVKILAFWQELKPHIMECWKKLSTHLTAGNVEQSMQVQ